MRGEILPAWQEMWPHVWKPLDSRAKRLGHRDLFCELYRELNTVRVAPMSIEEIADVTDDVNHARRQFRKIKPQDLKGEGAVIVFLEATFEVLEELGGDALANKYFILLDEFLATFSLRYDLRRPCNLCPTLPGVFASLMRDLRVMASQDAHLNGLMKDFEDAVRDLRYGCSDSRIKTCMGKQFMLLEALGALVPGVTKSTLGDMCDQIGTWPHATIRESLKKLYGFSSNYPGIRHGGNPRGVIRDIEMRDMVAMSILLAGFTPYLTNLIDADAVYRAS